MSEPLDLVVYGATGFTGGLVADYLGQRLRDTDVRWGIAGRNADKLGTVRRRLGDAHAPNKDLPIVVASADDPASLRALAEQTRVVLTTVGPFAAYGPPLVAACAESGTDYLDITGEPDFWKDTIRRHDAQARETGAIVVSCCGFDSIPHDIAVYFAAQQLPGDGPLRARGYVSAVGDFSGGTFNTALRGFAEGSVKSGSGGGKGKRSGPRPKIHRSEEAQAWVAPMPTVDPLVVRRSGKLLPKLYGEGFEYAHYLQAKNGAQLAKVVGGVAALFVGAKIPFVRRKLAAMKPPGTGPDEAARARHWFRVHVVAERGDARVRVEVRGGDPGYTETAKMVAESALCLVQDRASLPFSGGVLTPAAAFGSPLVDRLRAQGMQIEVVDGPPVGSGRPRGSTAA